MTPVKTVAQVLDAIQKAKAGATAFCTNFFPVQERLLAWIDHGELLGDVRGGVAFFLRKDRDFWHFYFCAGSLAQLQREITNVPNLQSDPVVTDLVGNDPTLADLLRSLESSGFRRYARLVRLARAPGFSLSTQHEDPAAMDSKDAPEVTLAQTDDSEAVLCLLESAFNPYADQLPTLYEIQEAILRKQILTIKMEGRLAALLYFETQGVTSTVRYWAVAEQFRSLRLGSVLMRYYFSAQQSVRRFILWVTAANEDALRKYRHYGYVPDGLVDHVLANSIIPT
jgi:ribosomal protein S18 acetylase RimI-like enzyme